MYSEGSAPVLDNLNASSGEELGILTVGSPFAVLVDNGIHGTGLAVCHVFRMTAKGDGLSFGLPEATATDPSTTIEGRVLQLVHLRAEQIAEADGDVAVRRWQWVPNALIGDIKTAGSLIVPLNPELKDVEGQLLYVFDEEQLVAIKDRAELLVADATVSSEASGVAIAKPPQLKRAALLAGAVVEKFPYVDRLGERAFANPVDAAANTSSNKWRCTICSQLIGHKLMRQHVGAHILGNHIPDEELGTTCGCCGRHGSAAAGCVAKLVRGSNASTVKPYVSCSAGYFIGVEWGQKAMSKDGKRCTNTPMECIACTPPLAAGQKRARGSAALRGPYFWKYHLEQHWDIAHPNVAKPQHGNEGAFLLGPDEKAHMQAVVEKINMHMKRAA
jgi:hypothetical protein